MAATNFFSLSVAVEIEELNFFRQAQGTSFPFGQLIRLFSYENFFRLFPYENFFRLFQFFTYSLFQFNVSLFSTTNYTYINILFFP